MGKTVVLIDDDQEDLDIMKRAIEAVDPSLACLSFVYPAEALRLLQSKELVVQPDFVFIDINMPVITGDKCLKALRKDKDFDDIIITLYSTSMPETVAEALKAAGANYVFEKPVRLRGYVEILTNIMAVQKI
ncbi:MAG TPA: response regulator [Chryseosolibacter sp.]|nr:response regulator [Chryseosolibacter sp.]